MKTYKPIRVGRSVFHKIRDVNHHFRVWGEENDSILFYLHGWADTGSTFQFVVDALKSNWRVIAPDLRGFGKSQHIRSNYWFPDYLADLDEMIQ
ncbi:MAG TPA: alpha/beta hydrolase, partial [Woeseiaceae bacterium]|nr:alpha/beta hydrolase [Woeseiaceae bacterium]